MGRQIDADRDTYETPESRKFISSGRVGREHVLHQISGGGFERLRRCSGLVHGRGGSHDSLGPRVINHCTSLESGALASLDRFHLHVCRSVADLRWRSGLERCCMDC